MSFQERSSIQFRCLDSIYVWLQVFVVVSVSTIPVWLERAPQSNEPNVQNGVLEHHEVVQ